MAQKGKLPKKQVLHIAKLANLKLSKKEISQFQKQLADILSYMDILNKLDTKKVRPTSQVTGLENVFRVDRKENSFSQKEALSGAKSKYKGYFKVKSVFD